MSRSRMRRRLGRRKSSPKSLSLALAGTAVGVPLSAAVSVVTLDLLKRSKRKERNAPRPGTFESHVEESSLTIYTDGEALYGDMLKAINAAQHSILMKTYIWKSDEVGQQFIDAFNAAAARGVDVFIIYDGFANLVVPPSFYRQLTDDVHIYRMPAAGRSFWKAPLRSTGFNHSKILVVDDEIGFVGGYNIGRLYARKWRDTHLRAAGPAVWGLRQTVARLWNEGRDPADQVPWTAPDSWNPTVRVVANMPVDLVYPVRNMYLKAIERAQNRIWISTPYFIPDQQILRALILAAERGVDVQVMVPKESNHVIADWVSRGFFGQMLDAGITILLYASSMMHSKTATIDGEWSTIGTANIDRLSLSFNYESNVEVVDPGFAQEMERVFRSDMAHCEDVRPQAWRARHPMARVTELALKPLRPVL
ncbi:phospholipase D-like domain-containing protein [Nesterenkonia natronophila]|uniref:Phosphatidylserine/phosphatidylglycerophosphate/ cardiolipin synthase family protein n=1 Tax=Nesterenkonia natronophila TaxID=2174932 RepID=A0A3A4FJH6_9MICC|nr:phospholipase D-like domain-containing protein [Nesterenkonia natronophila]RJN32525.1 phosphatidylserine/phosphatidylglycerophosphate/cardiolipin synthase family protein [Nesterenkonia natronophila]